MNQIEIADFFGNLHPTLQSFCKDSQIIDKILELRGNCADAKVFERRFFHLLNAFWILKYLNFAHATSYVRGDLQTEAIFLLQNIGIQTENNISLENLLEIFRNLDK